MLDAATWAKVPFHFWSGVIFVFGCIVGSFLNVCIHRMPLGQSIISPPSHCPFCGYTIPWYRNIPLVTWLWLRGQCANCQAPISIRYFFVELLTGVLFLGCWLKYGSASALVALVMCLVVAGLIVATFIDLAHFIIPDEITIGGIVAGFICSFAVPALHGFPGDAPKAMRASFLGIVVGGLLVEAVRQGGKLAFGRLKLALDGETKVFFTETGLVLPDREIPYEEIFYRKSDAIRFRARRVELVDRCFTDVSVALGPNRLIIGQEKFDPEQNPYMEAVTEKLTLPREAMGFGDVKFMAAIGAFLGWQATIFSLVLSSFVGAIVGGILILAKRHERANPIPYGPYIAAAAVVWIFAGPPMVQWFLKRLLSAS